MDEPASESWHWDPTLCAGSAAYYARGRVPYPTALIDLLVAAPHLFGERFGEFERELRAILRRASPTGQLSAQMREVAVGFRRR